MFSDIRALSFDCYGTLIDWQSGLRAAAQPVLRHAARSMPDDELFLAFAQAERAAERPPYRSYKAVLETVADQLFTGMDGIDRTLLWKSLRHWPVFDETPKALAALHKRFRLAVASNVDNDLFEFTRPKLGEPLDVLVTAEIVQSYKPGLPHFHELLRRLGLPPEQVLHVAESRYHDIEPANRMGMPCVWIDRAHGAFSASGDGSGEPTLVVGSLTELVMAITR